jgi:hypothetical protein
LGVAVAVDTGVALVAVVLVTGVPNVAADAATQPLNNRTTANMAHLSHPRAQRELSPQLKVDDDRPN